LIATIYVPEPDMTETLSAVVILLIGGSIWGLEFVIVLSALSLAGFFLVNAIRVFRWFFE
jgi:hypothetical protein